MKIILLLLLGKFMKIICVTFYAKIYANYT